MSPEQAHEYAVRIARAGDHDRGLRLLNNVLRVRPGYYRAIRDIVVILSWKGQCHAGLDTYHSIESYSPQEDYLVEAVSECLWQTGQRLHAAQLLESALLLDPDNTGLRDQQVLNRQRQSRYRFSKLTEEVVSDSSDAGVLEWKSHTLVTREFSENAFVSGRYSLYRTEDPDYAGADINRAALALRYHPARTLELAQEFSGTPGKPGDNGSTSSLRYVLDDGLEAESLYSTYSEDLPIRARALGIDASLTRLGGRYHSWRYEWTMGLSASRYRFSDSNVRNTVSGDINYAFELKAHREQRVGLFAYRSENTLSDTAYFNPARDSSTGLKYQLDIVHNSVFRRHVDHLYVDIGTYTQSGYGTETVGDVRYRQDYEFSADTHFGYSVGYGSHVYDGNREAQVNLYISVAWMF